MADTVVGDGQVSTGAVLNAGDRQVVQSETFNANTGGRAYSTTINNGGQQFLQYGASSNATVNTGGGQYVYGTGSASGTILNGGSQVVSGSYDRYGADQPNPHYTYGHADGTVVNAGGVQRVDSYADNTVVNNGGVQFVSLTGDAYFAPNAVNGTVINAGGSQFLYGGSAANTQLNIGGSILLGQRDYTATATLTFDAQSNTIRVVDGQSLQEIHLTGNYSMTAFSISENGSYDTFPDLIKVTAAPLCFCAGTHIMTTTGEIAVENLRVGYEVVTLRGKARPIRWIGETSALVTDDSRPVIIQVGAFGRSSPIRDLRVTPGHSFLFGDVLIPVGSLVNELSIVRDREARTMRVFHIELDAHDIVIAEGAPAESYRDDGNRTGFATATGKQGQARSSPTCAPVISRGPIVERTRRWLAERAVKSIAAASQSRSAA